MTTMESVVIGAIVVLAVWLIFGAGRPAPEKSAGVIDYAAKIHEIEVWQAQVEGKLAAVATSREVSGIAERIARAETKADLASDLAHKTAVNQGKPMRLVMDGKLALVEPTLSKQPSLGAAATKSSGSQRPPRSNLAQEDAKLKAAGKRQQERVETLNELNKQLKNLEK